MPWDNSGIRAMLDTSSGEKVLFGLSIAATVVTAAGRSGVSSEDLPLFTDARH